MFTGIVEELGEVVERDGARLRIRANAVLTDAQLGASIAVNGCCLTVVEFDPPGDGDGDGERPVRLDDRLGGHLVQGHVDAVGTIIEPAPDLQIHMDADLTRYVVEKGSITVDGISLTVVEVFDDGFTVAIIPHTEKVTTLATKRRGDIVNLEVDITAKHVEKLLAWHLAPTPAGGAS
jgi:riboflavin synthase